MTSTVGMGKIARVAEAIRADIRAGKLAAGQKLPNDRELAEQYGVAVGTVRDAVRTLQDEGWIVVTPSIGKFVTEERPSPPDVAGQLAELQGTVATLTERVEALEQAQSTAKPPAE